MELFESRGLVFVHDDSLLKFGIVNKLYGLTRLVMVCNNWLTWLKEYVGFSSKQAFTDFRLRNGFTIRTRPETLDRNDLTEIFAFKKYMYFGLDINDGDTVVDVGSHLGMFSLFAASTAKDVKVIAAEPSPSNFALLKHNVEANGCEAKITPCELAVVGSNDKQITLWESASNNSASHSVLETTDSQAVTVKAMKLADLFKKNGVKHCDFLKMDVEGAEYEIFLDLPSSVYKRISKISLEYHPHPSFSPFDLVIKFRSEGYKVVDYDGHRIYAWK